MIYKPAEDSYLLAECVKKYAKGKCVLDIGSGSGIQALVALENGARNVLVTDIDREAVKHLKKRGIRAVTSDLFSHVQGRFDVIVFNPPYLPNDRREDQESKKSTTGGRRGDEVILRFLKKVKEYLTEGGIILIVLSSITPRARILMVLEEQGMKKRVITSQKLCMERLEVWKIAKSQLRQKA